MGCGGSRSRSRKPSSCTDSSRDGYDRRPRVSVRMGSQVKVLETPPVVMFIFGGPGSRKGCVVDDLLTAYELKHICTEDLLCQELPSKLRNISKVESINDVKDVLEANPDQVTLEWILEIIEKRIDEDRQAKYLIDFIPNLRYMLKAQFLQENCFGPLRKFEEKYPISFALNLAIPPDKVLGTRHVYSATKGLNNLKEMGGKGDEADTAKLQRRATLYEQCSKNFLEYFIQTDRLITVDVTCGAAELIWHQVHQVLCQLDFLPNTTVNTVLLFVFDDEDDMKDQDYQRYLMEKITLQRIVDDPEASVESLLSALLQYINNNSRKTDSFVVNTKGTVIAKNSSKKMGHKEIIFMDICERYLESYLPGSPKNFIPHAGSRKYKAISSLENEVCLFPLDTSDDLCMTIALYMAKTRLS